MAVISPDFDQQRLLVHYLLSNYGLLTLHVPCFSVGICSQVHRAFVERKLHKRRSFYAKCNGGVIADLFRRAKVPAEQIR